MYAEDDLLPLSGLQHLVFCERQWGLIHIEQVWEENRLTAQGRVLHERAHEPGGESARVCRWRAGCDCGRCGWGCRGRRTWWSFTASAEGVRLS